MKGKTLNIATGLKVDSVVWQNKNTTWQEFVTRLSTPVKTNETFKAYCNASKADKGKIKDVGGYVAGYLLNGRRKIGNVVSRSMLTLDLDFANLEFWDDFTLFFNNAAVLHSSHSHSEKNPRYRLILPLSRDVQPDEYVAIMRLIAGMLNIELFDNTTFETNQLMFWPSTSLDAEYYFKSQEGEFIDADYYLAQYSDWRDTSLWPSSSKEVARIKDATAKQQNPTEKKGLIGLFCRAYSITGAIEKYLSDIYSEAANGCYTYVQGSTASGLKIYEDDTFAYSHHGTDPCGGQLCNAYDLVRIHKFGHLDGEDNAAKSSRAMEDLIREDTRVKQLIAQENMASANYDFADPEEDHENEDFSWATKLEIDGKGKYLSSSTNLNLIFANDEHLKQRFKHNEFDGKRYIVSSVPWRKIKEAEPFLNVDYSGIRNYIESIYGINSPMKIDDSLALELEKNKFHPIRKYLKSLTWDGVPRIDKILIEYFGATDNAYHREAIRKHLIAAVARVFVPGIKYDYVLTLVGEQGTGKSTFIKKLGRGWSSDSFITVQGNQSFEQLQGAWLIEIAELSALKKAEIEMIKHYLSKQEDIFRPAYMRASETFKRQCVFFATTNKDIFLTDPTGNRRFIPVDIYPEKAVKNIHEIKDTEIDNFWAEAAALFAEGETLFLSNLAAEIASREQTDHTVFDEKQGIIEEYLALELPENWASMGIYERRAYINDVEEITQKPTERREDICVAEIWCECLNREKESMQRYHTGEIHEIMRQLPGWRIAKSPKKFPLYGVQKYYVRKN